MKAQALIPEDVKIAKQDKQVLLFSGFRGCVLGGLNKSTKVRKEEKRKRERDARYNPKFGNDTLSVRIMNNTLMSIVVSPSPVILLGYCHKPSFC
jgi:hypothetical protein